MTYILKVYFAGTASTATEVRRKRSDSECSEDSVANSVDESKVIRVFFSGCQEKKIGGKSLFMGYLSPNLDVVTQQLVSCFTKSDVLLFDLKKLRKKFSSSVIVELDPGSLDLYLSDNINIFEISHIDLFGFSRGAVTSFMVARELNAFETNIDIYAEEPIPGESKEGFKKAITGNSFLKKAYHLQDCQYIRKAKIVVGDHCQLDEPNIWYRQMSPIFHRDTQANIYIFSKSTHSFLGVFGEMQLSSYLLPEPLEVSQQYAQQLADRKLNKLCRYLKVTQPLIEDGAVTSDGNVADDEMPTFYVNDMFYGLTIRQNFLTEPLFLPRPLKKSYHVGLLGRTQCAPSIKHWYHLKYQAFYIEPTASLRLKQVQSLCFLCLCALDRPQQHYPCLVQRITDESGNISENIGLRDFIIELGRTFNYFKMKNSSYEGAMSEMLRLVVDNLERIISTDFSKSWSQVKIALNENLKIQKHVMKSDDYKNLISCLKEIFKTSALFNSTLVKFIKHLDDERMECDPTISSCRAFDDVPNNAFELTKNMYFSTKSRREILFDEYKNKLSDLHANLENIIDLSHILKDDHGKALLKLPYVKQMINTLEPSRALAMFVSQLPDKLQSQVKYEPTQIMKLGSVGISSLNA